MRKYKINAVIDILMFIAFIVCAYSGFVLHLSLKRTLVFEGAVNTGGISVICMGLSRYKWTIVHIWVGWIFFALIVVHIILHFRCLRGMMGR